MILPSLVQIAHAANDINLPAAPTVDPSGNASTDVAIILNRVAGILLAFATPLAIVGVVYAGIALIRSAGKPDGYAKAKNYLIYVATGIFLIVFAGILVRFAYTLFR